MVAHQINIKHGLGNKYNVMHHDYGIMAWLFRSCHFYDLGAIHNTFQAFSVDHAILLAGQQFIPPAKEEIACDELEPRRERVAYNVINQQSFAPKHAHGNSAFIP